MLIHLAPETLKTFGKEGHEEVADGFACETEGLVSDAGAVDPFAVFVGIVVHAVVDGCCFVKDESAIFALWSRGESAATTYPGFALRLIGPWRDPGTSWEHDPMPSLRALEVPLLWIIAGADREAPPAETRRRLLGLAGEKPDLTLVEFPGTDHGIVEFEVDADGHRVETRIAEGYLQMLVDWIGQRRLQDRPYGSAVILARPAQAGPASAPGGEPHGP